MAEKKTDAVWMSDGDSKAYVPSGEADTWRVRGWAEADEPAHDAEFVWMRNETTGGVGRIAWGARDYHQAVGWQPSPPEEPVNLAIDPVLREAKAAEKPAKSAKSSTAKADKNEGN
ncbi:MAG TPA: hypothetical protein VFY84_17530 [Jiangellales bacterium]|nr:hypothetical protein [Jiangellales bacterium]